MGKIVLVADQKWRDFPGYVYAKLLFERLGHKVYLSRNLSERRWVYGVKPDVVILQHVLSDIRAKQSEEYMQMGIDVLLMPTEGLPVFDRSIPHAAGAYSNFSGISMQFCWGDIVKDYFLQNGLLPSEKVVVTGCPRFDFYRSPLKSILMSKEEFKAKYNIRNAAPIILWTTNFWNAEFKNNRKPIEKVFKELKVDKIWGDPDKLVDEDYNTREIAIENIVRLLKTHENINLIIKPHPVENRKYYQDVIKKINKMGLADRVRLIYDEYIWDLLNVADLLIQRSCTTGIEAWLSGVPVIEFSLNPNEWWSSKYVSEGCYIAEDYNELEEAVNYYLSGGGITAQMKYARQEFIEKRLFKIDGKSTERFVKAVDDLIKNKVNKVKLPVNRFLKLEFWREYFRYLIIRIFGYWILDIKQFGFIKNNSIGKRNQVFTKRDIYNFEKKLRLFK